MQLLCGAGAYDGVSGVGDRHRQASVRVLNGVSGGIGSQEGHSASHTRPVVAEPSSVARAPKHGEQSVRIHSLRGRRRLPPAWRGQMLLAMAAADLTDVLPTMAGRTLLLYGEEDAPSPLPVAEACIARYRDPSWWCFRRCDT